jgi:thymidylate synthase
MFIIIVAREKKHGIGYKNTLPWKCKGDMEHFKKLTTGNIIVMGHNTWVSIGRKPLKDRLNIVITREEIHEAGVLSFKTLKDCVKSHDVRMKQVFIIGGEKIYRNALNLKIVQKIYLTEICGHYNCDKFFEIGPGNFTLTNEVLFNDFTIKTLERNNIEEKAFINMILSTASRGDFIQDERTNHGVNTIFNDRNLTFDLEENLFPLSTSRQASLKLIFEELMMNIRGITDTKYLEEKGYMIWKNNSCREFLDSRGLYNFPEGVIGETYGFQMRNYGGKYDLEKARAGGHYSGSDQLMNVINEIKTNPSSRRLIINLWNPNSLSNCALPACACWYEFFVSGKKLSCKLVQRSSDILVAGHHNITYGCLFTILIAHVCNLTPAKFIWSPSNVHIYDNNIEFVEERINAPVYGYPLLFVREGTTKNIEHINFDDILLVNYNYTVSKSKYNIN